jgi:extracellular factor (EF) 3-hydroxypalmitic acid methyl ester biosynthesis protein
MESLNNINQQFETHINEKKFLDPTQFNNFLNTFKFEVERLEKLYPRDQIAKNIEKIRTPCSKSPFMKRVQSWPRGYQGDFETINYIMRCKNLANEGSFEYLVEEYFLKSDICEQHRNKVTRQAQLIKEAVDAKSDAKIISIGCGTSADVGKCIDEIRCSNAQITLVDVDQDALAFSMQQLGSIKERITALHGNIYKLMRNLSEEYDLILIGGVFDYLTDKTIVSILKSLRDNLYEDGKVFFTNINKNNRYRVFMEYLGDWFLIERCESDLYKLIANADWPEVSCRITRDKTGLTHLVELDYTSKLSTVFAEAQRSLMLSASY